VRPVADEPDDPVAWASQVTAPKAVAFLFSRFRTFAEAACGKGAGRSNREEEQLG
jgi:hypothetical protein